MMCCMVPATANHKPIKAGFNLNAVFTPLNMGLIEIFGSVIYSRV